MLDDQLLKLITTTGEILDLEDSVIEKDYFVTQVIHIKNLLKKWCMTISLH